jgi:enterochelin esterase-like enzyme
MARVRFEILPPIGHAEQSVCVCGNLRALGEWNAAHALRLDWDHGIHVGEIEADAGVTLEYKLLRTGDWEAEAVDAWGNVPPNLRQDLWFDTTIHRTVADWKDRYTGRLTHDRVHSHALAGWRELLVWLPPSYPSGHDRRYPVLYLNDGANVFDPDTSPITKVDLAADEWVRLLAAEGAMPEAMIVAVCHPEGFGEGMRSDRDIDLSLELGGAAYAHFLAKELAPAIDARYRTIARPEARLIGGASLGALNALFAAVEYPDVFGRMVGLSTALGDLSFAPIEESPVFRAIDSRNALREGAKFYLDYGTEGLDREYGPVHYSLAALLREKGWEDGREFHIVRVVGGSHDERSWRRRLGDALRFSIGFDQDPILEEELVGITE